MVRSLADRTFQLRCHLIAAFRYAPFSSSPLGVAVSAYVGSICLQENALCPLHRRPPQPRRQTNRVRGLGSAKLANFAKFCKFLAGSFSAVSKRIFARKYAFDSIFQALQDLHIFAPLRSQNFSKKSD